MSIEDMKNVDVRTVDCDSLVDVTQIRTFSVLPENRHSVRQEREHRVLFWQSFLAAEIQKFLP